MSSYYEKFLDGKVVCIDEEIPFKIPEGWKWCRLQDVCSYIQRGKSPIYSDEKMFPVIAQKCNQWAGFSIEKAQFINPDTINKYTEDRILQDHDLLWNSTGLGTLGRMSIYEEIKNPYKWAVADSHVTVIRPLHKFVSYDFLYAYFASPTVQNVIEDKSEGSTKQKELYVDTVKTYLIPLPPFAEQNKISERINFVLPVVSRYDEWQIKLDTLNEEIRTKLQKSVLQEAIKGRLVPQNPLDEPASILLERIETKKQNLMKDGKLKAKDAVSSTIYKGDDNKYYEKTGKDVVDITEEITFEIPENWEWSRLKNIVFFNPKNVASDETVAAFMPMNYINPGYGSGYKFDEVQWGKIKKGFSHFAKGDIAFAKITPCFQNRKSFIANNLPSNIGAGTTELIVLRPYGNTLCREYVLFFLQSSYFVEEAKFKGTAGQQRIMAGYTENKLFPMPPYEEQIRISKKINELLASIMSR